MTCLWKVYRMNEDLNAVYVGSLVATRAYVLWLMAANHGLIVGKGEPIALQSH